MDNNMNKHLDQIMTSLRAMVEEEVRRQVELRMRGGQLEVDKASIPVATKYDENVLFELENLASKGQVNNVGFDETAMQDLEGIASSYPGTKSDVVTNLNTTGSSSNSLDELDSMVSNPIMPLEATSPEMPDQISNLSSQPNRILDTTPVSVTTTPAPVSGIQNAFNILKRVIKS